MRIFLTLYIIIIVQLLHPYPSIQTPLTTIAIKQHKEALTLIKQKLLVAKPSQNISLLFQKGYHHSALGETEQARNCFYTILLHHPNHTTTLYNIGYTYKIDGDLQQARTYFKKALTLNPNYDNAHLALGFAYLQEGLFEDGWK